MPMRTYSSGMYGRLAFAVAVTMEPEILLIDEALSVGDARFRKKSFRKMRELCGENRTIMLVSHALGSIKELCDQAIWIAQGRAAHVGRPGVGRGRLHGVPRGRRGRLHDGGRLVSYSPVRRSRATTGSRRSSVKSAGVATFGKIFGG